MELTLKDIESLRHGILGLLSYNSPNTSKINALCDLALKGAASRIRRPTMKRRRAIVEATVQLIRASTPLAPEEQK